LAGPASAGGKKRKREEEEEVEEEEEMLEEEEEEAAGRIAVSILGLKTQFTHYLLLTSCHTHPQDKPDMAN
jgi:hypothetical protein